MWQPTERARGIMRAHSHPWIRHSQGMTGVVKMTIMAMHKKQMVNVSLKPFHILGTVSVTRRQLMCQDELRKIGGIAGQLTFDPERRAFDFFACRSPSPVFKYQNVHPDNKTEEGNGDSHVI
jgi:hypothetical protein